MIQSKFFKALVWSIVVVGLGMSGFARAQGNIALGRQVSASAETWNGQVPANLTDGNLSNQSHPLASSGTLGFYYEIDLGSERNLGSVKLFNRSGCCPERLSNYRVEVRADAGGAAGAVNWSADIRTDGSNSGDSGTDLVEASLDPGNAMSGRYLRVVNLSNEAYNPQIAEVEAFEAPLPVISSFVTDHGNITATGAPGLPTSAELSWVVSNADAVSIDQGVGPVGNSGSQSVSPTGTTTYTLTATNSSGSLHATVTVGVDQPVIPPAINEFMTSNSAGLEDQFGGSSDWIEIANPNGFDLSLDGYFLTDDSLNLMKWRIPAVNVPANGYLVIFASGSDITDPAGPVHTNFSLSRIGEYLALVDPDGSTVLTEFAPAYPEQKENVSYGPEPGGGTIGFFSPSSPGAVNGSSFAGFVEDTKFSLGRGFYSSAQTVEITTATVGATIRYTTDGSRPSETNGTIYSAPLTVSSTTVLRAMAYKAGLAPTNVDTNTYLFVDDVIASPDIGVPVTQTMRDSLEAVPSLSIVTSSTINGTSEVATSFELINPDGSPGFQENCGVKNFGGAFTNFDKKSFRMYFRSQYGASKLKYPLFEGFDRGIGATDTFDQLNIRSGSHDMVARGFYMSNRFTDDTMLDMGNINPHGRFMHLYLNGRYWGVYHVRERWSASTLTEYLDGPKSGYEAINGNWNVGGWADSVAPPYDGDGSAWARIKNLGLSSDPSNYDDLVPYLDMPHFIDYMIMWMYGNSEDEYRCVGPADVGSGFKWFLNDADGYLRSAGNRTVFASNTPGVFGRSAGDGPGSLFSLLFKAGNSDFRTLLADRIHKHYFHDGAMTPTKTVARLQERCDEMDLPFRAEAERWDYRTHASWTSAKNGALNSILPGRTATALSQFRSAGFYPATEAPVYNQHGGSVPSGYNLTMSNSGGTIYYATDGSDPRLPGGAVNPLASVFEDGQQTDIVVPTGSDWSYLDDGSDQGTAWKESGYDDTAWESGPAILGYGEADVVTPVSYGADPFQKHITTYFRKTVNITDIASILSAEIRIKRDDGAVVYLNGVEVDRSSMPGGVIDYLTPASTPNDDGVGFHSLIVPAGFFEEGDNVIAVEVHQSAASTSDCRFDLELKVIRPTNGDSLLTMTKNTVVKSRSLNGGEWSALNEAFFVVGASNPVEAWDVLPAEIHYNPMGVDDAEFIELHNHTDHAINLRGAFFSDGIDFAFPDNRDVVLAPDERVVLVDSHFGVDAEYGIGLPIAGVYRGNLNNGGETLILMASDGVTELFNVTFDGAAPWPEESDGDGRSLVLVDETAPNNAASWRPSLSVGGSPGTVEGTIFAGDPDADLDGDGVSAIVEFAMGTSDNVPNSPSDFPSLTDDGVGGWEFVFPVALDALGVNAVVEFSDDLQTWINDPSVADFAESHVVGNRYYRTYRSKTPNPNSRLFMRVHYRGTQ
ncbi:chitobiase/beta-hexosaminidase C-terminal domain-containing protein [Akkermansiaceae bacterium]|nr:chitobiase/beta-hexosaminidase C-terminal domain-containing protein [Akkermansiaceae bacterium]